MSRAESLRTLTRFNVTKHHPYAEGAYDWSRPFYRVRPRGFSTVLLEIRKQDSCHSQDFAVLMDAVHNLAEMAPPPIRKRRRKAKA